MRERDEFYVGLMSGTSLDGISAAVVRFARAGRHAHDDRAGVHDDGHDGGATAPHGALMHQLLGFVVHPYTDDQRARLRAALQGATPEEYCRLNFDLGQWLADAALMAIAEAGVARADVRAIASHGQTVWHVPGHSTWQFGEAAVIAERTGIDVVADFRVRDVAAGGHGAPLVPIADALLYASSTDWRLLQNVGGMANVTVVPPGGAIDGVRAFDTGPGVAIIDAVVQALYPGHAYDDGGEIAARGTVHDDVVAALLTEPYFAQDPPKSTGREHFGAAYAERLVATARASGASDADCVATATALTAASIADAYTRFVAEPAEDVLVSGGGARNATLVRMLGERVAPRRVRLFEEVFYDGEAKEAIAFALLGYLHVHRRSGNVTGATGARGPRVLGKLVPA